MEKEISLKNKTRYARYNEFLSGIELLVNKKVQEKNLGSDLRVNINQGNSLPPIMNERQVMPLNIVLNVPSRFQRSEFNWDINFQIIEGLTTKGKFINTCEVLAEEITKQIELFLCPTIKKNETLQLINGKAFYNDLGVLRFCNELNLSEIGIKRFYQSENFSKDTIKAFHGHLFETKIVWVVKGSFKVICVKMKNKEELVKYDKEIFILSSNNPQTLIIPRGYANGFKALEEGSIIQFFSTSNLKESETDDYRFDWNILGEEVWETKNR